jgi:O-antigen/teichoic acid export membrane protein
MRAVTVGAVPLVLVLAMWSEPLFASVFGESWRKSGEIFPLLAVPMVFGLLTGWPERVFEVREKQYISLAVQLSFDLAVVLVVTLMLAKGVPTGTVLIAYVAILTAYQLTYLGLVFGLSGLGMKRFIVLGGIMAGLAAAVIAADTAISGLGLGIGGFAIMLALTGAVSLAGAWTIFSIAVLRPKDNSARVYGS